MASVHGGFTKPTACAICGCILYAESIQPQSLMAITIIHKSFDLVSQKTGVRSSMIQSAGACLTSLKRWIMPLLVWTGTACFEKTVQLHWALKEMSLITPSLFRIILISHSSLLGGYHRSQETVKKMWLSFSKIKKKIPEAKVLFHFWWNSAESLTHHKKYGAHKLMYNTLSFFQCYNIYKFMFYHLFLSNNLFYKFQPQ